MKVALYHPWIYLHGGIERTILELVQRSRHNWIIYTGYYSPETTFPGFRNLDVRPLGGTTVNRAILNVLQSSLRLVFQRLPLDPDIDALVVCCDGVGDLVTFRNHAKPLINLCFTPLRPAFDPVYEKKALRDRRFREKLAYLALKHGFRAVDRIAWKRYRKVIAISEEVKSRIVAGGLRDAGRISVAYPGIDWPAQLTDVRYEPFVLVAGRIMWTKNIELAIEAFLQAGAPAPWKLVIAGYLDAKSEIYLDILRNVAKGSEKIEFVISPSDEELANLYRRASFTLFTPLNEDWGIAPLEAMRQAKPVIAVDSGGPRESIIDGRTGYLLPPSRPEWAAAINRFIHDPDLTRRMGENARIDVQRFTWDRFVVEVDDQIERCVLASRSEKNGGLQKLKAQISDSGK
jgi:glycosyltransferase involved in cell wall biosynthesis